jgi:hypothetical protein
MHHPKDTSSNNKHIPNNRHTHKHKDIPLPKVTPNNSNSTCLPLAATNNQWDTFNQWANKLMFNLCTPLKWFMEEVTQDPTCILTLTAQSATDLVSMLTKIRLAVNVCVRNAEEVDGTPTRTSHARSSRATNEECFRYYLSPYIRFLNSAWAPRASTC